MKSNDAECSDPHFTCSTFLNAKDNRTPKIWFSKRFLVMALLVLGNFLNTVVCLMGTMAVVEMTTAKQIVEGNTTIVRPAEFQWDSVTVGVVLNTVWYGGLLAPVGGTLAQKFGGSVTSGLSLLFIGLLTLIAPIALYCDFYMFLTTRGLVGVLGFFCSSANPAIFSSWMPKKERPVFMSAMVTGMYVGVAIVHPVCGFIAYHWGWRMIFYSTGFLTTTWSIIWLTLVRNDPSDDRWISRKELIHILDRTGDTDRSNTNTSYPYKEIFTSSTFWALSVGRGAFMWGTTFTAVFFPLYVSDKTGRNLEDVGYISSIPQLFCAVLVPIAGVLMGYWQNHGKIKTTTLHKFIISGDFIIPAALFAIIPFLDDFLVMTVCFTVITVLVSYNRVVLELITISMAPNHSGLISGLSQSIQTVGSIVAHTFIGYVVKNHRMDEWNVCFFTWSGVLLISAAIFAFYGSSEPQAWSVRNHFNSSVLRSK